MTTEKDAVNLCDGADELLAPLPLYWLEDRNADRGRAELLAEIEKSMIGLRKTFSQRRKDEK